MIDVIAAFRIRFRYLNRIIRSIPARLRGEVAHFTCHICGHRNWNVRSDFRRERADCICCQSNPRVRGQIALLSLTLYDRIMPILEFPRSGKSIMSMSEFANVEQRLSLRENFINTWLHQEPFLDIVAKVEEPEVHDIILSGEVFEHVKRPVETTFHNLAQLPVPGGVLVLSIPYANMEGTIEHFPPISSFQIDTVDGRRILRGTTATGEAFTAKNLVFHGGRGDVLPMRLFGKAHIERMLANHGFVDVRFLEEKLPEWGIIRNDLDSFPLVARKA